MSAPAVGQLTPADLPIGTTLHLTGMGNNRAAAATTADVVKVGRKLVTVAIARGGWTYDVVLRLDTQCENDDFAGWAFRTAEQQLDDARRLAARTYLRDEYRIEFTTDGYRGPLDDRYVDVDLAEALVVAADAWRAQQ